VTLANWRTAPFNRWAFHHLRELGPSADVPNDPASRWLTPGTPHSLLSVSKSRLGLLAGTLVGRKHLPPDRPVTDVVPEVAGAAYDGATIRHLLDMRVGIAFEENYLATSGSMAAYRKARGWEALAPGESPSGLQSFYRTLTASAGPHGGPVHYVSPNTDLLGWVIERATGAGTRT